MFAIAHAIAALAGLLPLERSLALAFANLASRDRDSQFVQVCAAMTPPGLTCLLFPSMTKQTATNRANREINGRRVEGQLLAQGLHWNRSTHKGHLPIQPVKGSN